MLRSVSCCTQLQHERGPWDSCLRFLKVIAAGGLCRKTEIQSTAEQIEFTIPSCPHLRHFPA